MDANRLQSLVLAALCIAAVGVSATTIESTLSTDPDDVINLDPAWLPIGQDSLIDAKDEMEANAESDGASGGEENTRPADHGDRTEAAAGESDRGSPEPASEEAGDELARAAEQISAALGQGQGPGQGLLERLLDLLRRLLIGLLAVLLSLVVILLGRRYVGHLRSTVGRNRRPSEERPPWPPGEPDDEIARAWLRMVRRLDVDRPRVRTPGEWAVAAIDAGMDPEAVEEITSAFREVRYGDAPSSEPRRRRARAGLERLDPRRGGTT